MGKKFLVLLVLIFASKALIAQRSTLIKGHIKDSIGTVPNATIVNLNSKKGTSSNDAGIFEMHVRLGDSLQFSSVQHIKKTIYISKNILTNIKIDIRLLIKTTVLESFELKKHNLSGRLGIDIKKVKTTKNEINAGTLELPNAGRKKMKKVDREIYTAITSSSGISLDYIINTFSGRIKKLKKKKKIVEEDIDVFLLLKKFNYNLETNFKIHKDDAFKFLYFCRTDAAFNKNLLNNEFELIKFLQRKAVTFNKLKKSNLAR